MEGRIADRCKSELVPAGFLLFQNGLSRAALKRHISAAHRGRRGSCSCWQGLLLKQPTLLWPCATGCEIRASPPHSCHNFANFTVHPCPSEQEIGMNLALPRISKSTSTDDVSGASVTSLLSGSERRLILFAVVTGIAGVLAATLRQQLVDWAEFLIPIAFNLELILVGVLLRKTRHLSRVATCIIAIGLNFGFLVCYSILIFTVLPFSNPMIDRQLMNADAALGFSWLEAITYLANYPTVAIILRFVYLSLIPQFVFVIIFLSFLKRNTELHLFLMVGFLSFTLAAVLWWLFPSVGPAAYKMASAEVQQKIHLVANSEYGEKMWRYATQGNDIISQSKMAGVVAFPSMHLTLTCMILWFTRGTYLFVPLVVFNFVMPVATVLQGGHHIMDLFGGLLVFYVCVPCAKRLLRAGSDVPKNSPQPI